MTIKTRRIIYITFIIVFITITPIILLYTAGYRYDFKKNTILKTGGIFLLVKEPRAKIYLDGKLEKESGIFFNNEIRFNNLLPNNYHLSIEKEGYYSWEKTLPVYSRQTTFAEHPHLFLNQEAKIAIETPCQIINVSPNQKYLTYFVPNKNAVEIWIFNIATRQEQLIYKINNIALKNLETEKIAKWSLDSKKILITFEISSNQKIYLVANLDEPDRSLPIQNLTNIKFENLDWGKANSNILYGINKNIIYEINLLNNNVAPAITTAEINQITDIFKNNDDFYYLANTPQESFLMKKNTWNGEKTLLKLELGKYEFILNGPENIFSLYNITKNEITLIDKSNHNILFNEKISAGYWNQDGQKLLYYTDFELWCYSVESNLPAQAGKKELISRYSQKIKKAQWIPETDYIIFLLGNDLKIIELDGRDKRNFYHLTENIILNNFIIDKRGEWVYFSSGDKETPGLYKLQIR